MNGTLITPAVDRLDQAQAARAAALAHSSIDQPGNYSLLRYIGGALITMASWLESPRDAMEAEARGYGEVAHWIEQGPREWRSDDGRWLIR